MQKILFAQALGSGRCPIGLYPTPLRDADNRFITLITHAIERKSQELLHSQSTLYEFLLYIREPEHYSAWCSDEGVDIAEALIKLTAYHNYMSGASTTKPIVDENLIMQLAANYTEALLASKFLDLYNSNELTEDAYHNYRASAKAITAELQILGNFFTLSPEDRSKEIERRLKRREDAHASTLTNATYKLSSISENELESVSSTLTMPEDDQMSNETVSNYFPDIQQNIVDEYAVEQEAAERHSENLKLQEKRMASLKVNSADETNDDVVVNDMPIFKMIKPVVEYMAGAEEVFNPFAAIFEEDNKVQNDCEEVISSFDAMHEDDDYVQNDFEEEIEPISYVALTPKKEEEMYQANSRSGFKQVSQNIPQVSRQNQPTGSGLLTSAVAKTMSVIMDINTNAPVKCSDGYTNYQLPSDMLPSMNVFHYVENGQYVFRQDGTPILAYVDGYNQIEWTYETDPLHSAPQMTSSAISEQRLYQNAVPEYASDPSIDVVSDDIMDAAFEIRRKQRLASRPAPEPEPVYVPQKTVTEVSVSKAFGEIVISDHDGSLVSCKRRSESTLRALDGFPEDLGILGKNRIVLIAIDEDMEPVEYLVNKDDILDYEKHIGQFEQTLELDRYDGTVAHIATVEEKTEDVSPFKVIYNSEMDITADGVSAMTHILRVASETESDLTTIPVTIVTYPRTPAISEGLLEEIENILSGLVVKEDKKASTPLTQIFGLISRIKDIPTKTFLDNILTKWIEYTIKYRLAETTPEFRVSSATKYAAEIAEFTSNNQTIYELAEIFKEDMEMLFSFDTETEMIGEEEKSVTVNRMNIKATCSDCEDMIPLGRILFDTHKSFYRHVHGAFNGLEEKREKDKHILVTTAIGEVLRIVKVGSGTPLFYCVEKL